MILEIDQMPTHLDISYISKEGNKQLLQVPVPYYYNWVVSHEGQSTPGFIDISGKPVLQVPAKSFRRFDLMQFLKNNLSKEQLAELFEYREANLICSDIETNIGDRFPRPELAEQPINTISCVDQNFNILAYTTFDCNKTIEWFDDVETTADDPEGHADHKIWTEVCSELVINEETKVLEGIRGEHGIRRFEDYGFKLVNPDDKESKNCQWWFEGIETYDKAKIAEFIGLPHEHWPKVKYLLKVRYRKRVSMGFRSYEDEINAIVHKHIGYLFPPHKRNSIHVKVLQYSTEKQMLEAYLSNVVRFASVVTFWNGDNFDKPYILNRCRILGIPVQIGSITGELDSRTGTPKHTIFTDYMFLVDEYGHIAERESLRLDFISNRILGIGKLPYRGTLKEMQEHDVCGFIAYNVIDSALIQLIHERMRLMSVQYGFAMVTRLPLSKALSQVAQTESLISLDTLDWLDAEGIDMPERPKLYDDNGKEIVYVAAYNDKKIPRRPYGGGHVKNVWKHFAKYMGCVDFSGLYPSLHRSYNLSIENYVGPLAKIDEHYGHIKRLLPEKFKVKWESGQSNLQELQREILDNKNFMTVLRKPVFADWGCFIFRFSERIREELMIAMNVNEFIDSADWLHIAFVNDFKNNYQWYIFPWDTRQVLANGIVERYKIDIPDYTLTELMPIDSGEPLKLTTTPEHQKWLDRMIRNRNKTIPTLGGCNVYLNDHAYAYKRIQIYLRAKRDVFKKRKQRHYAIQQPMIEYALWERGLWPEKPNLPIDKATDKPYTEWHWKVYIGENEFNPNLLDLNQKVTEDYVDQFGDLYRKGDYKDSTDFLWFLFHENLRQGQFELNMEMSYKLVANSLYGATSNEFNSFNNIEVADDTTAEGRNAIQCAAMLSNNYMNFEWPTDKAAHEFLLNEFPGQFTKLVPGNMPQLEVKDRIIYIDTDSLYLWYEDLLESSGFTGDKIKFFVKFYDGYLGDIIEKRLHDMTNGRHGDSMMKFDLEYVVEVGVWTQMKKYLFAMAYEDGRYFDNPIHHLKVKGMDLVQQYLSEKCRGVIREAIEQMLAGEWKSKADYQRYMMQKWVEFQSYSIEDISKRVNIKKEMYEKYVLADSVAEGIKFGPRCGPQYRGAAYYNWWIDKLGKNDQIERIEDGNILFYHDKYGTEFSFRINNCPEFAPEPDRAIMFMKIIVSAINRIAVLFDYACPLNLDGKESTDYTDNDDEQE